jgi:hypothetical protein
MTSQSTGPSAGGEAMQRPVGVTILSVLNYLVGAYLVFGSMFGLLTLWPVLSAWRWRDSPFAVVFLCVTALFLAAC